MLLFDIILGKSDSEFGIVKVVKFYWDKTFVFRFVNVNLRKRLDGVL